MKEIFKPYLYVNRNRNGFVAQIKWFTPYENIDGTSWSAFISGQEEYDFSKKTKIYFLPGCNIPRFKVREFCKAHGHTIVLDYKKADIAISGTKSKSLISRLNHQYSVREHDGIKAIILSLQQLYHNNNLAIEKSDFDTIKSFIDKTETPDKIFCSWDIAYRYPFRDYKDDISRVMESSNSWISTERDLDEITYLMEKDIPIVNQNVLSNLLNTVVIDKEMYTELSKMLDSEDHNNHVLAMEMMANTDYEESALYLLFLLKNHSSVISYSKVWNHVNFSALKQFFDLDRYIPRDIDSILDILTKKKLLKNEDLGIVTELRKLEFMEKSFCDDDWFDIDVSFSPNEKLRNVIRSEKINDDTKDDEFLNDNDDDTESFDTNE